MSPVEQLVCGGCWNAVNERRVTGLTLRSRRFVGRGLISRIRRNRQTPSPAHSGAIEFVGNSTNQAYLVVLAIDAGVRPGKAM